jgi:hypothetical protein
MIVVAGKSALLNSVGVVWSSASLFLLARSRFGGLPGRPPRAHAGSWKLRGTSARLAASGLQSLTAVNPSPDGAKDIKPCDGHC